MAAAAGRVGGKGAAVMNDLSRDSLAALHDRAHRAPADMIAGWEDAPPVDPRLFQYAIQGDFWDILAETGQTLLVSREYEHLVLALRAGRDGHGVVSYLRLPHPSGIAVDADAGRVYIASTRNPNRVMALEPASGMRSRGDTLAVDLSDRPLIPVALRYYPGCLYLHDLALIGGRLHGNAVGENAVVVFEPRLRRIWWPRCVDRPDGPITGLNHLQLNSIAAGPTLEASYFTASADVVTEVRPGDPAFPMDRRGVVFSGATREPIVRGLTRPHSARLHGEQLWVDNSGYGEVGVVSGGVFEVVARLRGWTRGLCFHERLAFVGLSRVLPRFQAYAPGLAGKDNVCGVAVIDINSGRELGALIWPWGNQIFALERVPAEWSGGFPFRCDRVPGEAEKALFYAYLTTGEER